MADYFLQSKKSDNKSRVSDQNGVSLLYIMLETRYSDRGPSKYFRSPDFQPRGSAFMKRIWYDLSGVNPLQPVCSHSPQQQLKLNSTIDTSPVQ